MRRLVIAGALVATTGWAARAEPVPLGDDTVKQTLAGRTVQLDTPLGVSIPIVFQPNGLMSGKAGVLAYFLGAESDRGRWWVANGKLCQKWFKWLDAQPNCMRLAKDGHTLYWRRDDGMSGTATIQASLPPGAERGPNALGGPVDAPEPRRPPVTTQASMAASPVSAIVAAASRVRASPPPVTKTAALVLLSHHSRPPIEPSDSRKAEHEHPVIVAVSQLTMPEQDYRWCAAPDAVSAASPDLVFVARLGYADSDPLPSASACLTAEPALRHVAKLGIDPR
jgi:hypothetical protein